MCSYGKEIFEASHKEQAIAHIFFKKQTKTLFFYKIKSFCCYIDEHLRSRNLGVTERFIYLRDQFFFSKFSFFFRRSRTLFRTLYYSRGEVSVR